MDMTVFTTGSPDIQPFMHEAVPRIQARETTERRGDAREARALRDLINEFVAPESDSEASQLPTHDDAPQIGNTSDVAYQIRQINQCLEDASAFMQQAEEAREFYERRIVALEARADFLKENVGRWLKINGMQKLATHSGTIYFSKRTKVTLPDDETLVRYANNEDPSNKRGLITQKPNKAELKKYIASSGHAPDGYREENVEHIAIRKVA